MNEVWCLDLKTGREFTMYFNDLHKQRLFLLKCKYSKKILVTGYTYNSQEEHLYLARGI